MTQEELDALMNGVSEQSDAHQDNDDNKDNGKDNVAQNKDDSNIELPADFDPQNFRVDASKDWPPPPPNKEHKVVHQLDDVTRDTEVKAGEVFDQLDIVDSHSNDIIKLAKNIEKYLKDQESMFQKLCESFPHIQTFQKSLSSTTQAKDSVTNIINNAQACLNATMQAMDIMQFQDINRQRIERVINVMRALSQYMNSLFESKIDDTKRVASAVFIPGDKNDNMANSEEIENLIASFGQK